MIEILVVLFIISIVTTVAMLSISVNDNRQIENFANELSQMLMLAEEQAMLEPNVLGLTVSGKTVQFASFVPAMSKDKPSQWVPLKDTVLGTHAIPNNMQVTIDMGAAKTLALNMPEKLNPQIIISTNGDATAFTIYVGKSGQKPLYAISGAADGNITTRSLS